MSPKQDVSEERKNQILDAAMNVFVKLGLNKARMDDIVSESGMSKGGVYWYFKSKDEIIFSVLERLIKREMKTYRMKSGDYDTATEKLYCLVELLEKDMRSLDPFIPAMYEVYAYGLRNKTVRKLFSTSMQEYIAIVMPIIEEGIQTGEFRPCDPYDAAITIGAIMEGTILLKGYTPEGVDLNKHIRIGMDFFINGLKTA